MSEQYKTVSNGFLETAWKKHDVNGVERYVAADHVAHGPFTDQMPTGLAGVQAFIQTFLTALPNVSYTVDRQEVQGDAVQTWLTFRGTQTGPLLNIPPSGRNINVPVLITDRIANGKIAETWSEWDTDDFLHQLGAN